MPYLGYEPSKVAVTVGQGVIDATHIQDASITTADLGNDSVTPIKIDDDGTGFQMGSLGLGTAVSGSEKLTVGGTASFSGNITGNLVGNVTGNVTGNTSGSAATVTGATQSAITSLGTLTGLAISGNIQTSAIGIGKAVQSGYEIDGEVSSGNFNMRLKATGTNQGIRVDLDHHSGDTGQINFYNGGYSSTAIVSNEITNGLIFKVGGTSGSSKIDALQIDNSGSSTFKGDGVRLFVNSADYELVSIGRAGSSGSALDQGYIRMKNAGTNTIALHSASNSYFTNGLSIGTSSMNSNAVVHIRGGNSGQSSSSNNTQLTVENSGTAGIQLLTGTSNVGGIWVGDSNGSETGGKLYYSNSSDSWIFYNQGSVKSVDLSTSMLNLYDNDTGSAGSTLKQLSVGDSDSTYWNTTSTGTFTGIAISNSHADAGTACGIQFSHGASSSGISYVVSRSERATSSGGDRSSLHFGTRGSDGVARRLVIGDNGLATFAGGVAINGASIGSHKLVVDNGTTSLNRGNSGGDILDVRGLNTSHFKVTTSGARSGHSVTSVPNASWTNLTDLTSLSAGLYMIHVYKDNYAANDWSARGIVEATGHSTIDGDFENQSGFQLRVSGSNVQLYHTLGQTFGITSRWLRIG